MQKIRLFALALIILILVRIGEFIAATDPDTMLQQWTRIRAVAERMDYNLCASLTRTFKRVERP